MNTVLRGTRDFTWPFALVMGGGLATLAVVGIGPGQPIAAPPAPAPTATVIAPPTSSLHAKPAPSHTSAPAPRAEPTGGRVEAAAAPRSGGSSAAQRPGSGAPSGPAPHPPAASQPPAATTSCDVGLSLLALDACLKLGGR